MARSTSLVASGMDFPITKMSGLNRRQRGHPRIGDLPVNMPTSHERVRPVETDTTVILASRAPTLMIDGGTSFAGPISEAARWRKAAMLHRDDGAEKVHGWKDRQGMFATGDAISPVMSLEELVEGGSNGGLAA